MSSDSTVPPRTTEGNKLLILVSFVDVLGRPRTTEWWPGSLPKRASKEPNSLDFLFTIGQMCPHLCPPLEPDRMR